LEDNIRMYLREIGWEVVDRILLEARWEVGLDVNTQKTKFIVMS